MGRGRGRRSVLIAPDDRDRRERATTTASIPRTHAELVQRSSGPSAIAQPFEPPVLELTEATVPLPVPAAEPLLPLVALATPEPGFVNDPLLPVPVAPLAAFEPLVTDPLPAVAPLDTLPLPAPVALESPLAAPVPAMVPLAAVPLVDDPLPPEPLEPPETMPPSAPTSENWT